MINHGDVGMNKGISQGFSGQLQGEGKRSVGRWTARSPAGEQRPWGRLTTVRVLGGTPWTVKRPKQVRWNSQLLDPERLVCTWISFLVISVSSLSPSLPVSLRICLSLLLKSDIDEKSVFRGIVLAAHDLKKLATW